MKVYFRRNKSRLLLFLNTRIGVVVNKISDVRRLVKNYNANISDIEKKYFSTSDQNKFTKEMLDTKMREKELVDKSDISNLVKKSDLNKNNLQH